jgi:hypothetical protein
MQKYKDVDGNIIKLKLFCFSLRGRAKDWLISLPRNSIDFWDKCKDAFIGKYYPTAKIIALRSDIMKFIQFDNEYCLGLGKNKIYDKELSHLWTYYLDDCPNFLCRTEFFFKEPIGFSCWRHFYVSYLGRRN